MNHKWIITLLSLQAQILDQLHSNHIGIEKIQLPARESVYWINMNADRECVVKWYATCLESQWTKFQVKILYYKVPCRPWVIVGQHVFIINNRVLLHIVDYHSKFPIAKKVNSLSADDLLQMTKLIFAEYRLLKKTVYAADTNFTSETCKDFYRHMNIQQTITSSYHC